jgi:hypothetical protein
MSILGRSYVFERKIKETSYDKSSGQLTIVLDAGISRTYLDVPHKTYDELSKAPNPSQYYNDRIDGQFRIK